MVSINKHLNTRKNFVIVIKRVHKMGTACVDHLKMETKLNDVSFIVKQLAISQMVAIVYGTCTSNNHYINYCLTLYEDDEESSTKSLKYILMVDHLLHFLLIVGHLINNSCTIMISPPTNTTQVGGTILI